MHQQLCNPEEPRELIIVAPAQVGDPGPIMFQRPAGSPNHVNDQKQKGDLYQPDVEAFEKKFEYAAFWQQLVPNMWRCSCSVCA